MGIVIILQAQRLLGQQQRQLKGNAINPVVVKEGDNAVNPAQDIVPVDLGNLPLIQFIDAAAIIPGQDAAGQQKEDADNKAATVDQEVQRRPAPAGPGRDNMAQRRQHRPDYSIPPCRPFPPFYRPPRAEGTDSNMD